MASDRILVDLSNIEKFLEFSQKKIFAHCDSSPKVLEKYKQAGIIANSCLQELLTNVNQE